MRAAAIVLALLLGGGFVTPGDAQTGSAATTPAVSGTLPSGTLCLAEARTRAAAAHHQGASREAARRQLEIDAASCLDPTLTPAAAHLIGSVNADRARFARDFLIGKMTLAAYRTALADRADKLARLLGAPAQQAELVNGDADGDLVPDSRDRCPGTPDGRPTDARGCPIQRPRHPDDQGAERSIRATLAGTRFLYNRSCEGAPAPRIPSPLEWGRGAQTKLGSHGFNLAVTKVAGQPAGCEIFYEIQFRFIDPNPGNPALPPSRIVTVVFSDSEDLLMDPRRAVFPLPVGPPLAGARGDTREAMLRSYFRATWRVRAVNGSNLTSEWSPFVTQGPAPSGVDG